MGTLCCYTFITLINLIVIRRKIPHAPRYLRLFVRPALATAAMAVVASGVWRLLSVGLHMGRGAAILAIILAAAVYAAACLLLGAVTREDLICLPKGDRIANFLKIHGK